jgi:hypothetical protein
MSAQLPAPVPAADAPSSFLPDFREARAVRSGNRRALDSIRQRLELGTGDGADRK